MLLDVSREMDLDGIIESESIIAHFQPIVSIKKQKVIGFEGLSRGYCPGTGKIIPPIDLFNAAAKADRIVELDHVCRKRIFQTYSRLYGNDRDYLLFINVDVSGLKEKTCEDLLLLEQAHSAGIEPTNVVIEIVESKAGDMSILNKFVQFCKYYRFLVAVDDVGAGHSNLDRIALIRPDLIKTDRSLIGDIDKNYFKQEIFKSLVGLSRNIGSLMLAEGIETEEQAICALQIGASLFQGFYFGKPKAENYETNNGLRENLENLSMRYSREEAGRLKTLRDKNNRYKQAAQSIAIGLSSINQSDFNIHLEKAIQEFQFIDALYIIDLDGSQLTKTVLNGYHTSRRGSLFKPAVKGDSHSLKDYYYFLTSTGSKMFTTDPYISLATGKLCRTISHYFKHTSHSRFILCLDIIE